jgi:flagellar motor switch protein FliG
VQQASAMFDAPATVELATAPSEALAPMAPHLNGLQKATVLLLTLGPQKSAEIFRHLSEAEAETLALEMVRTRQVTPTTSELVCEEVLEVAQAGEWFAEGGMGFARRVLEASVGSDRAGEILGRMSAIMEMRPFEFLRRTQPEQIVAALRNEGPQTVALIVSNLHTNLAAQVLAQLPVELQAEVAIHIAEMGDINPDVVREVDQVMRHKLSSVISQEHAATGGVHSLADILTRTNRATERHVIEALGEHDAALADEIRGLLFVFEDVVRLDDRSVQMVLKEVDHKQLALALRGVPSDVKDKVMRNLSQRGAEMLEEEIRYQQPQRRSVVEEAQGKIVGVIRRLEEAGALVISRQGMEEDEDELVV